MSLYVAAPSVAPVRPHVALGRVVAIGAVTTYYYRETGGARGSATSAGAIPAGAVVLRAVTS